MAALAEDKASEAKPPKSKIKPRPLIEANEGSDSIGALTTSPPTTSPPLSPTQETESDGSGRSTPRRRRSVFGAQKAKRAGNRRRIEAVFIHFAPSETMGMGEFRTFLAARNEFASDDADADLSDESWATLAREHSFSPSGMLVADFHRVVDDDDTIVQVYEKICGADASRSPPSARSPPSVRSPPSEAAAELAAATVSGRVKFRLSARDLPHTKKCNAKGLYLAVKAQQPDGTWEAIYASKKCPQPVLSSVRGMEVVMASWPEFDLDAARLCDGRGDRSFRIEVMSTMGDVPKLGTTASSGDAPMRLGAATPTLGALRASASTPNAKLALTPTGALVLHALEIDDGSSSVHSKLRGMFGLSKDKEPAPAAPAEAAPEPPTLDLWSQMQSQRVQWAFSTLLNSVWQPEWPLDAKEICSLVLAERSIFSVDQFAETMANGGRAAVRRLGLPQLVADAMYDELTTMPPVVAKVWKAEWGDDTKEKLLALLQSNNVKNVRQYKAQAHDLLMVGYPRISAAIDLELGVHAASEGVADDPLL